MKKRLLAIFAILLLIVGIKEWHYLQSGGFKCHKIVCSHCYNANWESNAPSSISKSQLAAILNQDFFYLGKGRQVYVFESRDHEYILKFVRVHRYRTPFWFKLLSLENLGSAFIKGKTRRFNVAMNSYKLAFEEMREETKVLFIHLNKNDQVKENVVLRDKLGRKMEVKLDDTIFLLQKKVVPLKEKLSILKDGSDAEIKQICSSFLQEIMKRAQKGILNYDFLNVMQNYGYFENEIVEMDLGSFSKVAALKTSEGAFRAEVFKWSNQFRSYLVQEFPAMLSYFDNELKTLLQKCEDNEKVSL